MAVIFISHSSQDRALTEDLAGRLRARGYRAIFLDFDVSDGIAAGSIWERQLYSALRRSDGLVFLATAASVNSRWCFAELALARSLNIPVFAVRVAEDARLSLIEDVQWIDLAEGEPAYDRLWAGMSAARLDPAESRTWDPTRPPYPGLRAFSVADAAVFFGRTEETRHLVELVQPTLMRGSGRWITIVGPSGSGKSSLLCAGLLPNLADAADQWVVVPPFAPGSRPTHKLAVHLARVLAHRGIERSAEDLERSFTDPVTGSAALVDVARSLSDAAGSGSPHVLISIDQAEEIITRTGPNEQEAFLRLIKNATGEESPLWVVCTIRSEYLSTAPERAGVSEVTDDSVVLEPLSRNRLSEVIARPARRAGLEFEPGLVERMVEETTGGDALPLLAHTLYELAHTAVADERTRIRFTDYELLGGVVGALERRADQLLRELTARGHGPDILPTLLRLVTLDQDGAPVRRRVARSSLGPTELRVVDAFVEARLLSSGREDGGTADATVEVTHEALLRQWAPLRKAIDEARTSLRLRSELEREAADWAAGGREDSYLLRGSRLGAFDEWVGREGIELAEREAAYLAASKELAARELSAVKRTNRRLVRLLAAVVGLLLVATAAGAVAVDSSREAQRQADRAEEQAAIAFTRQLIAQAGELRPTQPDLALLLGVEALREAPDVLERDAQGSLFQTLSRPFHRITQHLVHSDAVRALAFDPGGGLLAAAGDDGEITLWDLDTGDRRGRPLAGHEDWVQDMAFSPDATTLASASRDGTVRLWDPATGKQRGGPLVGHTAAVTGLAFHPREPLLATAGEDGTARLWEVAGGRQRGEPVVEQGAPLWSVDFSPDGGMLLTLDSEGSVRLWDLTGGRPGVDALGEDETRATAADFSRDGARLALGRADGTVRLWDMRSRAPVGEPMSGHVGEVGDVVFTPDGSLLASGGQDGTVRLWDTAAGRPRGEPLTGHADGIKAVDVSPDGRHLASASADRSVRVWELETTFPGRRPLSTHGAPITDLDFGPAEDALLAAGDRQGAITLWDPVTGEQRGSAMGGHAGWVTSVAFSPDGGLLASGDSGSTVRLWQLGHEQPSMRGLDAHTNEIGGVAFHPDGEVLVSGDRDGAVHVWDVTSGETLGDPLTSPARQVLDVAFSPDGATLAVASQDGTVRLWDWADRRERASVQHSGWVLTVAWDAGSRLLASGSSERTIVLWDSRTERARPRLTGHLDQINDLAFSPDGAILVSASRDGSIRLWDVRTGRSVGEPLAGDSEPTALDFRSDTPVVAVGRDDGSIELWDVDPETLVPRACATANRNMTTVEWDRLMGRDRPYRSTCPVADERPG